MEPTRIYSIHTLTGTNTEVPKLFIATALPQRYHLNDTLLYYHRILLQFIFT